MACLLWNKGLETGCFDFGECQTVGRDCFSGSPSWIPRKVFEIYIDRGRTYLYCADLPDWFDVYVYQQRRWVLVEANPVEIDHQTMIQFGVSGTGLVKMLYLSSDCYQATTSTDFWGLDVWRNDTTPSLVATSDGSTVLGPLLVPIAEYLQRYRWAGVLAILILMACAYFSLDPRHLPPHKSAPQNIDRAK
jgi:hypothetical protein